MTVTDDTLTVEDEVHQALNCSSSVAPSRHRSSSTEEVAAVMATSGELGRTSSPAEKIDASLSIFHERAINEVGRTTTTTTKASPRLFNTLQVFNC